MTEVSIFQAIKTSLTFSRFVITFFAMRVHLVLGHSHNIAASSSRIIVKVMLSCLVWWLWSVLCMSAVKIYVLAVLFPVIARLLKSNRSNLLFRPAFSRNVSLPVSLPLIIAFILSIAWRHVCVLSIWSIVSVSASCILPWVILTSPVHGVVSILFSATRIIAWYLFWLCSMLSVSLISDQTNSSELAVFSVRNWLVIWFTPAELWLAVPMGFVLLTPGMPAVWVFCQSMVSVFRFQFSEFPSRSWIV